MPLKLYDIPDGFKVSVNTNVETVRFKDEINNYWGLKDSSLIRTNKVTAEVIKVLSDLKILDEERTYLEITNIKSVLHLNVRLNENKKFDTFSKEVVLSLKAFGSSGYLIVSGKQKVPLRPASYRKDVIGQAVSYIAAEKIKPTMDMVGRWFLLDLLFSNKDQKLLTKMAISNIRFDIALELLNQNLVTEEDIQGYQHAPSSWLEELLEAE